MLDVLPRLEGRHSSTNESGTKNLRLCGLSESQCPQGAAPLSITPANSTIVASAPGPSPESATANGRRSWRFIRIWPFVPADTQPRGGT